MLKAFFGGTRSAGDYSRVWWILNPHHMHQCEDCKRLAAGSPYGKPGSGRNELFQTPGDGRTSCGADCTCILSYSPPGPNNPDMATLQQPDHLTTLLKSYTHEQVRFIEEYGLESRKIDIHDQVDALVLTDGSLIKPSEYQCFLTAADGAHIELWKYPPDTPFPPEGKWWKRFEESQQLVAQWPVGEVRWVLNPDALRRYEATAPALPVWNDHEEMMGRWWMVSVDIAKEVRLVAMDAARERGCTVELPALEDIRPSYHHVGYDVRLHGTRTVTFKNGNSREQSAFLYVHVVPEGQRYAVRSCLLY